MLALSTATRIYLYRRACDMRKSFDGLCGLVRSELDADPLSGALFVFCNRRRNIRTPYLQEAQVTPLTPLETAYPPIW